MPTFEEFFERCKREGLIKKTARPLIFRIFWMLGVAYGRTHQIVNGAQSEVPPQKASLIYDVC